jgi:hypothetical protein
MFDEVFRRKEQIIREQRTIEAMRKGYMGAEGKLSRIAKIFGEPIMKQGRKSGAWSMDRTAYIDPTNIVDENSIPMIDPEEWDEIEQNVISYQIGWKYDGMRRSLHLEITWNDDIRVLKTYYKGNLVYAESGGDLDGYTPGEWEDIVESLYEEAKKKDRANRKEDNKEIAKVAQTKQKEFLDAMKLKWGI